MSKAAFLLAFSLIGAAWAKNEACHSDGTCDVPDKEKNDGDDEVTLLALRAHSNISTFDEEFPCECWVPGGGCNCGFRKNYDECVVQCDCKWTEKKPRGCVCGAAKTAVDGDCDTSQQGACSTGCGWRRSETECQASGTVCQWTGDFLDKIEGKWAVVGQNVKARELTYTIEKSKQDDYRNAIEAGLAVEGNVVAASVTATLTYTHEWGKQVTNGVSMEIKTTSLECTDGNLWQYGMEATGSVTLLPEQLPSTEVSFVCIPDNLGSKDSIKPKCPGGYCADKACQCCSEGEWMADYKPELVSKELVDKYPDRYPKGGTCVPPTDPSTGKPVELMLEVDA